MGWASGYEPKPHASFRAGAWRCRWCYDGTAFHEKAGSAFSRKCAACGGGGEGWAPGLLRGAVLAGMIAAYTWFVR